MCIQQIHANNLANLMPDPWYAHYHYSHPSLTERLLCIQHWRRAQDDSKMLLRSDLEEEEEEAEDNACGTAKVQPEKAKVD